MTTLLLLGGGLDSTALLINLRSQGVSCRAIHFQYGQRAAHQELLSVAKFCRWYSVPLKVVDIDLLQIADSDILTNSTGKGSNKLEGRNAIFVMMAATYAASTGCNQVCLGYHQEPADAPFPDATAEALSQMQRLVEVAYTAKIHVWAPMSLLTRTQIVREAHAIDPRILTDTHTCYNGVHGGCGECAHCKQLDVMKKNILNNTDDPLPRNS